MSTPPAGLKKSADRAPPYTILFARGRCPYFPRAKNPYMSGQPPLRAVPLSLKFAFSHFSLFCSSIAADLRWMWLLKVRKRHTYVSLVIDWLSAKIPSPVTKENSPDTILSLPWLFHKEQPNILLTMWLHTVGAQLLCSHTEDVRCFQQRYFQSYFWKRVKPKLGMY